VRSIFPAVCVPLVCALAAPVTVRAQDVPPAGFKGFVSDVGKDYLRYPSLENGWLAAVGGVATLWIHQSDERLRAETEQPSPTMQTALKPGSAYGNFSFQFPLALLWWTTGHVKGSARGASAGRDLVRAQISAATWTYVIKYAVDRTRPNGDPRSFPSGHASATFATATVLQQHYGWKLGVPMYLLSTYTACERVTENKHWASDVAFGAVVGIISGRTVTVHVRRARLNVQPQRVPGGAGVIVHVLP